MYAFNVVGEVFTSFELKVKVSLPHCSYIPLQVAHLPFSPRQITEILSMLKPTKNAPLQRTVVFF